MQAARTQAVGLSLLVASLLLAGGLRLAPLERWSALVPWVLLWGLLAFAGCALTAYRRAPEPWPGRAERGADLGSSAGGGTSEPQIRRQLRLDALLHPATVVPLGVAATSVSYLVLLGADWRRGAGAAAAIAIALVMAATSLRLAIRGPLQRRARAPRATADGRERAGARARRGAGDTVAASQAGARIRGGGVLGGHTRLRGARPGVRATAASAGEPPGSGSAVGRSHSGARRRDLPARAQRARRRARTHRSDAGAAAGPPAGRDRGAGTRDRDIACRQAGSRDGRDPEGDSGLSSGAHRAARPAATARRSTPVPGRALRGVATPHAHAIRAGGSETSVDSVVEALQGTIQQGKEVQKELRRLGY